ncbi:MAG TPA: hypothetical protein VFH51_16505, partial [Myxococcota bacterium]|nr:hypothetical protein [Myxococcota bacterium]
MESAALLAGVRRLVTPPTAPYAEHLCRDALCDWLADLALPPRLDAFGNVWVTLQRGAAARAVAFVAHMDHPALRVTAVKGRRVRVEAAGGLPTQGIRGVAVRFPFSGDGATRGTLVTARVLKAGGRSRLAEANIVLGDGGEAPTVGDHAVFD